MEAAEGNSEVPNNNPESTAPALGAALDQPSTSNQNTLDMQAFVPNQNVQCVQGGDYQYPYQQAWGIQPQPPTFHYAYPSAFAYPAYENPASLGYRATPPAKRGRKPGVPNKKPKKDEDDPDYMPPTSKNKFRAHPYLPDSISVETEVPQDDSNCCAKCHLWSGSFVILPCVHYLFCIHCLQEEKYQAMQEERDEICFACKQVVSTYMRGYRCVGHPNNLG